MSDVEVTVPRCSGCGYSLMGTKSVDLCVPCLIARALTEMKKPGGMEEVATSKQRLVALNRPVQDLGSGSKKSGSVVSRRGKPTKKALKKEKLRQRDDLLRQLKTWKKKKSIIRCILCGEVIPPGTMLSHKQSVHGESAFTEPVRARRPKSVWTPVFSGGLPGLGKRR